MSFSMSNILRVKNIFPIKNIEANLLGRIFSYIYDALLGTIFFDGKRILVRKVFIYILCLCIIMPSSIHIFMSYSKSNLISCFLCYFFILNFLSCHNNDNRQRVFCQKCVCFFSKLNFIYFFNDKYF